jgi:hypothetical protein
MISSRSVYRRRRGGRRRRGRDDCNADGIGYFQRALTV